MNQVRKHQDSALRKGTGEGLTDDSSAACAAPDPGRRCAYNQTRERFLCADVEAADFSTASLDARLPALSADAGKGLWLVPFRGLSPTSVRIPVDLVYLDPHCTVLDVVESFPIFRVSAASVAPTTVLALPAGTLRSTETQPGDQLALCPPEEMQRYLQRLASSPADAKKEQAAALARSSTGRVLQWEDHSRPRPSAELVQPEQIALEKPVNDAEPEKLANEPAPAIIVPQKAEAVAPVQTGPKPAKGWLQRLLGLEPPDARKAKRESLPGLAAYFFTGGAPVAHGVRDISLTGMYVLTGERWYPGTMVRMTLTDCRERSLERSITVNTTVVRCGDDGVGLKFALHSSKDRHRRQTHGMTVGVDEMEISAFLHRVKSARA